MKESERPSPPRRGHRTLKWALFILLAFLTLESFLPPGRQPLALLARAAIGAYRSVGSPVVRTMGVRCRYTPSCSAYADAAYARHGTVGGTARTLGRLLRCAPWGGSGHDPVD